MRSKKALRNISASFVLQIVVAISGLIVPRFILTAFGSDVNGLTSSITQFLSYIALVEGGIAGVTRAALYKPLAENDIKQLSIVTKSTEVFFRKISYFFLLYIFVLMIFYPLIVENSFDWFYTSSLIGIIGISTFGQYYFGITYQTLLQADQRQYIANYIQVVTIIINTIIIVALISFGSSIHIVRLFSATIFLIRPIVLHFYVNKHYSLDKKVKSDNNAVSQKRDGLGHHMAYFIHSNTDVVILTLFSSLYDVSVYAIYSMIVRSITNIVKIFSSGIEAAFGNMISNNETENLKKSFTMVDTGSSIVTVTIFSTAIVMILPFVQIYTTGVEDTNYIRPAFAYLILLAEALYSMRLPYQSIALAAGKYKETKKGAYIEAVSNILISLIMVNLLGLIGVAIGTLISMLFRTLDYMLFAINNILHFKKFYLVKRISTNISIFVIVYGLSLFIGINNIDTYIDWVIKALVMTLIAGTISVAINFILYSEDFKKLLNIFLNKSSIKD
ncbi:polysaccharide biosynthesis C-terminal domain-containing protein [Marinilactibacillus sp. GCM10026970]|uniref:polysaccharide biosynthesis C-terminal domain-containing protein n=1 Tax=Marinilactibacillus sp. GCM10026970 TaxID=3252642 RepID=UPI0036112531